jgi:hypothetical protein
LIGFFGPSSRKVSIKTSHHFLKFKPNERAVLIVPPLGQHVGR